MNEEYIKYHKLLCNNYHKLGFKFSSEDLENCINISIWQANKNYNSNISKYTTFLSTIFTRECCKLYFDIYKPLYTMDLDSLSDNYNITHVDFWLDIQSILGKKYYNILIDRFIGQMTYQELSQIYDIQAFKINKLIADSINILKQKLN